jgi:hypothetical protein
MRERKREGDEGGRERREEGEEEEFSITTSPGKEWQRRTGNGEAESPGLARRSSETEEEEEEWPSKRRGGRGLKRGKRGLRKEGGREKGRGAAKKVDRAFPRNRRVTAEAKRRVAGGEDWGGEASGQWPRLWFLILEQAS